MASQNDRDNIRALQGIGRTSTVMPFPPQAGRWTNPPVTIGPPTQPGPPVLKNPYLQIGAPISNTTRTNPTARQTLMNGPVAPRKTVRDASSKPHHPFNSSARRKKKSRASAPSELQRPTSREIIDIDASTDDLDLIADPPPTISTYFDSKRPGQQEVENESPTAGPSLIADGENTRLLQVKHSEAEPQKRSSSPIETFLEDEGGEKNAFKPTKPRSKVQEQVAKFEARGQLPIVNFRQQNVKSRMQPKGGNAVLKPPPQPTPAPMGKSPGRGSNAHSKTWSARLPISMLLIGIQQLPEYDTVVIDKNGAEMSFESLSVSKRPIGPISISSHNFEELQYSVLQKNESHRTIFYLKSYENATFGLWRSNFSNVFHPGHGNSGQLSVQFDTDSKKWDGNLYKTSMEKLGRCVEKRSTLRPAGCEVLWSALKGDAKYISDGQRQTTTNNDEGDQQILSFSGPASESSKDDENHDIEVAESSSSKQRVEDLNKFRYTSGKGGTTSNRKRVPSQHHKQDLGGENSETEPPPKRQRTEELKPPRRSTRQQEKTSKSDPDEVVLVYPFGVPGSVTVTTGDLARLEPEEFLNDTLIEFGLKSWLKAFEATNPELAPQVHVFNSFFYKKLNKRNIKEGYDSVRKWTSKIDIFTKKCIIVPINENLHWYLALIYEPEHLLQSPSPSLIPHTTAVTRLQARELETSNDVVGVTTEPTPEPQITPEVPPTETAVDEDMQDGTTSETEVERLAFSTSCSVTTTKENSSTTSSAEDMKEELVKASSAEATSGGSPMRVDTDLPVINTIASSKSATSNSTMNSGPNTPIEILDDSQPLPTPVELEVTPARFYGKPYTNKGRKTKARDSLEGPIVVEENASDTQPRTKIFIMDSLGNRHPQAMKQLGKWLELEAMDKKGVENITPAIAKMAQVPVQPNYCDCGLYILHFAATFMSDPQHYSQIIMTKERPSMAERQADWKDASVATMRNELQQKILLFSSDWRQWRASRGEQPQQQQEVKEEDEESDVAIVEHVKASSKKGKSNKSRRQS